MYMYITENCPGLYLKQALYSCLNKNRSNLPIQIFLNKHEVNFDDHVNWPIQELQKTSLKRVVVVLCCSEINLNLQFSVKSVAS